MSTPPTVSHRLLPLLDKPVGMLFLHEIYRSIQGESTFAGLPCVFVRLAVCDSRCAWCDTPHAFTQGKAQSPADIVRQVEQFDCPLVEITGGEPLLQEEVYPLMTELADRGLTVLLETSGAHKIDRVDKRVHIIMDLKCPDSQESARNCWQNLDLLKPTDQIKFVVASENDFAWCVDIVKQHNLHKRFNLLISPVFGVVELCRAADWILESGLPMRLQLQMHKYIWDPDTRGV